MEDRRCQLGLAGRLRIIRSIENGSSLRSAAAESAVSVATAHRWWSRWRAATPTQRASLVCLATRSSRPRSCPWALSVEDEQRILQARARTNYGPARLAGIVGFSRGTIWKVLARHGVSRRRSSPPRQTYRRYEWAQPGALLHQDTKRLPRFDRPGHWAHGDRRGRHRDIGYVYAHCVVDDHSRLAYVELHSADNAAAATSTLRRAIAWMREQGCGPVEAVMTDNAFVYRHNASYRQLLADHHAQHIRIPPYTPRWNGKVERFIQTLDTEWAHGRVWPSSSRRDRALASFLRYYNRRRPHTSLGDRAPISRVHHDRRQDT